ncbi:MAG: prenyltransferase [Anaerolineae bacterium]|nr:prenyltransferase [Anaerolineae bacterium]
MGVMRTVAAFLRLGRVHFLVGGVVLHLLGVAIALYAGASLNLAALIGGQITISAVQLMTHYANDFFDLDADRANPHPTHWAGGSRVLVEKRLPRRAALAAALALAGIALAANAILSVFVRPGLTTFLYFALSQALAWFYSAPPLRLHSRGLGEFVTMLLVTLLTPLGGYYLQRGEFGLLPVLAAIPLCCFQFAMLLTVEFPDVEGDRIAGKGTLVVRLGPPSAARLYAALLIGAYAALPLLIAAGLPSAAALALLGALPLALWQVWRTTRGDWRRPERWNPLAFTTIVLLLTSAAAQALAFGLLWSG